jgi:DNA replication protein DnaC
LVYCGNPGIGKTFLCSALIEFAMTRFESFRYWDESQLLQRIRESMGEKGGDYLKTLGYLIDDPFVMLDDIGSCGLNDWRKEIIFDTIDERYKSTLPTVITSNFSKKEFQQNFHPRLSSRLFDKQNIIIEILDGVDHRTE